MKKVLLAVLTAGVLTACTNEIRSAVLVMHGEKAHSPHRKGRAKGYDSLGQTGCFL